MRTQKYGNSRTSCCSGWRRRSSSSSWRFPISLLLSWLLFYVGLPSPDRCGWKEDLTFLQWPDLPIVRRRHYSHLYLINAHNFGTDLWINHTTFRVNNTLSIVTVYSVRFSKLLLARQKYQSNQYTRAQRPTFCLEVELEQAPDVLLKQQLYPTALLPVTASLSGCLLEEEAQLCLSDRQELSLFPLSQSLSLSVSA